ncbi:unnamed protein product [Lactuca saligna]|uniref:Uncharacterized protein n=1 Tax=Lactuca saligna TaxID=75948 RepID=A0AA35UZZ5_LACSI|nr:unnamed protein product [Lactuca saligna]
MKNKGGFREEDELEEIFNETFERSENVDGNYWMLSQVGQQFGNSRKSNRVNEDDDVDNQPEFDCRKQKQIVKEKKKKKKVVASDIVDAKNHILEPPIVKPSRPSRVLKHSQYLSSPYVSVQNVHRYSTGGGCNALSLYMENKPAVFMKHQLYNEKMEAKLWDLLFCATDLGFLDESVRLLNERRPNDDRWTIMSSLFRCIEML